MHSRHDLHLVAWGWLANPEVHTNRAEARLQAGNADAARDDL